jgi:ABC-type amino acid transport substrate-binding protein
VTSAVAIEGELRYGGDEAFAPFESLDAQGVPRGFQIDLLSALAAYRHLSRRDASTSVKAMALGLGFTHLGRFAQAYRELVGDVPSETLASGLQ